MADSIDWATLPTGLHRQRCQPAGHQACMFEVLSIKAGQADPAQFDRASTRMTVTITIIYTTSQPCFFILMSDYAFMRIWNSKATYISILIIE